MRVIHINSDYGNTIYKSLADELFKLGVEQRAYKFVRPNQSRIKFDNFVDVRVNYNNKDRYIFHLKHNKVIKDFLTYYNKDQVDILHAHTLFSNGYIAYKVNKLWGKPYIVTIRSTDINVFFKRMVHLRKLGVNILQNAYRIIFISPAHKEEVYTKYVPSHLRDELKQKTEVIPNGVSDIFIKNMGTVKKIDTSRPIKLGTVGWLNNNKNQLNVCKAVRLLREKGYEIEYKIIGGSENPSKTKRLVKEIQKYSFVTIEDRKSKEQLIEEYRSMDIFVMVSHFETFGLTYIEALTQGTPIIYSKGQGVDGYFKELKVGSAAKSSSVKDIAQKITEVIKNYNKLSGNTTREVSVFKWSDIAKRYNEIYKAIMGDYY